MIAFWLDKQEVRERVYLPKYYNPELAADLRYAKQHNHLISLGTLEEQGIISITTGDEIGKLSYGTGDIPFVRTSDISNWELKTLPKQGVSEDIYVRYAGKQDVQVGDILLVKDGTYLIGGNCFITEVDKRLIYQSHIYKIRINDKQRLDPRVFFAALNTPIVQKQIRSVQFTADIIDTIGKRYREVVLAIPKSEKILNELSQAIGQSLTTRAIGKAFVKACPRIIEDVLRKGDVEPLDAFLGESIEQVARDIQGETVTGEFGDFTAFWLNRTDVRNEILLPKYYDPDIDDELVTISRTCDLVKMQSLAEAGVISFQTGDEVGKLAYGTGEFHFLRTTDFANWEIKHNPKQGVSEQIYDQYSSKQDLRAGDILLVRDGTYLVGSACIVTESDVKALYCGGLYRIRVNDCSRIDPHLLLGLLSSYIVKRQIRARQFTRDVIDTLGKRLGEIVIPIPKDSGLRKQISDRIEKIVKSRIAARLEISKQTARMVQ